MGEQSPPDTEFSIGCALPYDPPFTFPLADPLLVFETRL
jgi:hypothetical protein